MASIFRLQVSFAEAGNPDKTFYQLTILLWSYVCPVVGLAHCPDVNCTGKVRLLLASSVPASLFYLRYSATTIAKRTHLRVRHARASTVCTVTSSTASCPVGVLELVHAVVAALARSIRGSSRMSTLALRPTRSVTVVMAHVVLRVRRYHCLLQTPWLRQSVVMRGRC